jgi:uncharacterized lipoprotein YmbA
MAGKGTVGQLLVEMRADLSGLRIDVKEMERTFQTSFSNIQSSASSFARILGASFSAAAIINYGKQVVELGGQLKDLTQQTGLSGQTLSGLKSTLEENGTSLDAFAKGIFTLQKNLGGIKNESDPAAQAVKALGLNLDELRKADTETFLTLVTDALGKIDNPINRAALGAQLLGKNFRELGPAINEMAGHLAELRKGGLSDDDINRLDEFGDSITRLNNKIKLLAAEGLATLIRDLSNVKFLFQQMFNKDSAVGAILGGAAGTAERSKVETPFVPPVDTEAIKKMADAIKKVKEDTENFIDRLQKENLALQLSQMQINQTTEEIKKFELEQEKTAFINKTLRDSLAKTIPPELLAKIDQWNAKILENTKKIAEQKRWIEEIQAVSKAWVKDIDAITTAEEKWAEIKFDPASLGMDDLAAQLDEISKKYVKLIVDAQAAATAAGALPDEIETVTRRLLINKALEQVRARVGFTGEGVDAEQEAKDRADKLGQDLADSLTSGMRNTLSGIETGQQTLGEGMKNLVRNMLIELQGAIFDKTILEPLKAIAAGFISGLVGALDDAANTQLKDWAKDLGKQVSSWLGSGLSSIFGGISGAAGGSSLGLGNEVNLGFATGGMIPSFASGGLFIGHGGEFVLQKRAVDNIGADTLGQMNKTGKVPGGGHVVNVEINGDITPRQPNMSPDQVVRVTAGNITNDGMIMSAIEQRLRLRGK